MADNKEYSDIWRVCDDSYKMLDLIKRSGITGFHRQLRLFACKCAEEAGSTQPECKKAIEISKRLADGKATRSALSAARLDVYLYMVRFYHRGLAEQLPISYKADCAAMECCLDVALDAAMYAEEYSVGAAALKLKAENVINMRLAYINNQKSAELYITEEEALRVLRKTKADLLRSFINDPFMKRYIPLPEERLEW